MELTPLIFAALSSAKKANDRIDELPLPMVFKGTLGTGGTIESLPTASSANEGYVYIVITDGTYAGQSAKAGDTFVSDGSSWVLVPSGDEPSVIDDSVTSTALTWSSKKISDECKVKSFTYKGKGAKTNNIIFSSKPLLILTIQGEGYGWTGIGSPIIWGLTKKGIYSLNGNTGSYAAPNWGTQDLSYDDDTNTLTITSGNNQGAMNTDNITYTVYYI